MLTTRTVAPGERHLSLHTSKTVVVSRLFKLHLRCEEHGRDKVSVSARFNFKLEKVVNACVAIIPPPTALSLFREHDHAALCIVTQINCLQVVLKLTCSWNLSIV